MSSPAQPSRSSAPGQAASSGLADIRAFDGFRAAAVLLVVGYHITLGAGWEPNHEPMLGLLRYTGTLGLDLFFVISGFLLFLPSVVTGSLGDPRAYAIRRIGRIVPAYYVSLVVVIVALPLFIPPGVIPVPDVRSLFSHLTFLQLEALPTQQLGFGVNGVVWTLSVEAIFYLLLPLIAPGFRRMPLLGLGIAVAISLVWRTQVHEPTWYVQFPLVAVGFASGMAAAWVFVRLRQRPPSQLVGAGAVVALLAVLVLGWWGGSRSRVGEMFGGPASLIALVPLAIAAFCVLAACAPRWTQAPFVNRPIRWVGEISYSVYLYHLVVIHFAITTLELKMDGSVESLLLMTAVTVPASLLIGWASYVAIERPARRAARHLAHRYGRSGGLSAQALAEATAAAEPADPAAQ